MSTLRPITKVSDAAGFFKAAASTLEWGDLADQVVMDLGCGTGNSSKTFATLFPKVKKVIAVDILPDRVVEAQKRNPHPLVDYQRADVSNKFTLARWTGEMDKAVSIFCFNCVLDQKEAYENLFGVLRPGGEAAILQSLYSKYYDFLKELAENPKWAAYIKELGLAIPKSHFEKFTAVYYRQIFEEIGFEVIECTDESRTCTYDTDAECKDATINSCPLSAVIPSQLKSEFKEDVYETFLRHNDRNDQGQVRLEYCTLSALLRRPEIIPDSEDSEDSY